MFAYSKKLLSSTQEVSKYVYLIYSCIYLYKDTDRETDTAHTMGLIVHHLCALKFRPSTLEIRGRFAFNWGTPWSPLHFSLWVWSVLRNGQGEVLDMSKILSCLCSFPITSAGKTWW